MNMSEIANNCKEVEELYGDGFSYIGISKSAMLEIMSFRKQLADRDATIAEMREALEMVSGCEYSDLCYSCKGVIEALLAKYPQKGK